MADVGVAILGASGMLGTDLAAVAGQCGIRTQLYDLPQFDITDAGQLARVVDSAEIIVNCAAYTNVDGAEIQSDLAHKVNAEAVGRLGTLACSKGRYVVHISTDFVFDGRGDEPWCETDEPEPINEYGDSKLEGEKLLAQSGCGNCIVRVQWTYGAAGNNFPAKILQAARSRDEISVVDDQVGSPTATAEVARTIVDLLDVRPLGLYHFSAAGYASRYEVARFILDETGVDCGLSACKSADFPSPARRPLNSRFDCSKISGLLSEPIRPWQEPLREFLRQL